MSKLPSLWVIADEATAPSLTALLAAKSSDHTIFDSFPEPVQYIPAEKLRELVESWRERIGSGDWPRICADELEALLKEPGE